MAAANVVRAMDREFLPFLAYMLMGVAMMVLGVAGELLGWWNDLGENLVLSGAIQLALGALLTYLFGASRKQVAVLTAETRSGFREVNERLGSVDEHLGSMDQRLGSVDQRLGSVDQRLGSIEGKLDEGNGILREIRDRLPPPR